MQEKEELPSRGIFFVVLVLAIVFIFSNLYPASVLAGQYHEGSNLLCPQCHTMHYSGGWLETGGPFDKLLRSPSPLDICLSCHKNDTRTSAPDVIGADIHGTDRAAGFFPDDYDTDNPNGHNLSANPPYICQRCHWASPEDQKVTCIDCHAPHGNAGYRNLQWSSDPGGEPEIRAFIKSGVSGFAKYERSNIGYVAPSTGAGASYREVTNICLDCHHVFSGNQYTGGQGERVKHPVVDTERDVFLKINDTGNNTDPTHWVSGQGEGFSIGRLPFIVFDATDYDTATTVAEDNGVFCLSCHKAHGSQYDSSLRWDYTSGSSEGCQQCHNI
jgi:hypothetical protein